MLRSNEVIYMYYLNVFLVFALTIFSCNPTERDSDNDIAIPVELKSNAIVSSVKDKDIDVSLLFCKEIIRKLYLEPFSISSALSMDITIGDRTDSFNPSSYSVSILWPKYREVAKNDIIETDFKDEILNVHLVIIDNKLHYLSASGKLFEYSNTKNKLKNEKNSRRVLSEYFSENRITIDEKSGLPVSAGYIPPPPEQLLAPFDFKDIAK
jgi:hypothetical protein